MFGPSRDPEVCLNIRRLELAGRQSKTHSVPVRVQARERGQGLHFRCRIFLHTGRKRGQITLKNSTLTFTMKTNRYFSIIYTAEGQGSGGEIALNYSSL